MSHAGNLIGAIVWVALGVGLGVFLAVRGVEAYKRKTAKAFNLAGVYFTLSGLSALLGLGAVVLYLLFA